LSSFPIDAENVSDLLKFADNAMYPAKISGKNNTAVYSQNKRRYLRIDFFETIHVRRVGFNKHADEFTAKSKNISKSGILFESRERFEIGAKVQLMVPLPENADAIVMLGRVVRVEMLSDGRYAIGVSFLELDQAAKTELAQYVFDQLGGHCN